MDLYASWANKEISSYSLYKKLFDQANTISYKGSTQNISNYYTSLLLARTIKDSVLYQEMDAMIDDLFLSAKQSDKVLELYATDKKIKDLFYLLNLKISNTRLEQIMQNPQDFNLANLVSKLNTFEKSLAIDTYTPNLSDWQNTFDSFLSFYNLFLFIL